MSPLELFMESEKGTLVAEIQESSNVTYRVYDYDRKDKNGKKRETSF